MLVSLDTWVKGAAFLAGFAYVAGVLIVNVNLGRYSFPSPDLTQTRYVLVGALWMLLMAIMYLAFGVSVEAARTLREEFKKSAIIGTFAAIAIPVAPSVALFVISALMSKTASFLDTLAAGAVTLAAALALARAAGPLRFYLARVQRDQSRSFRDPYVAVLLIALATLLLQTYASFSYPKFRAAIGGGSAVEVLLAPIDGRRNVLLRLNVPLRKDGLAGPCHLVFEDNATYFVLVGTGDTAVAVRLSKALFDGAVNVRR
jgi:hypothetical protein